LLEGCRFCFFLYDREAGPLINDYLLLDVPFGGEGRITFENTLSVVR
jgi:hypothetical protein